MVVQWELILALLIGISAVVLLIMKTKVQAFPALLISAMLVGVIAQMPLEDIVATVTRGFGNTLGSIGIIIGLGVMMGRVLEKTGAAKRMALTILKLFGIARADVVLALSGYLVSIPVFCDSGFVILSALAKEFSRITKKSMVLMGCSLGFGLLLTHHLVPPTPGPLAVAGLLGVDIGMFILWGASLALIILTLMIPIVRAIAKRNLVIIPEDTDTAAARAVDIAGFDEKNLPGTLISFAPIIVPLLMILTKTVTSAAGLEIPLVALLCDPVPAVTAGMLIAVYGLMYKEPRQSAVKLLEDSLGEAGLIILITGAGGALGQVLRDSGIGAHVAEIIQFSGFPAILLPLVMASLLKLSQGSGTVAMITTASILAPMIESGSLNLSALVCALAICVGSMCASYFNDSYFWVVTRFSGMDVKTGVKTWTLTSALMGLIGSVIVIVLSLFI